MKYIILTTNSTHIDECMRGIAKEVNAYIAQGWKPQGGVAIASARFIDQNVIVSQAMVKEDEEPT